MTPFDTPNLRVDTVAQNRRGTWISGQRCKPCVVTPFPLERPVADPRDHGKTAAKRSTERLPISIPARLTWKDASGAVRFASVMTRDVSDNGVFVECEA